MIGNLFTNNGSDKKKLNLLVFLTPHVVRTRDDLRALALDERQKFTGALGRREMHQMPMEQYKEIYKPTFSVPVSPAQDLKDNGSTMAPMAPSSSSGGGFGPMPSSMVAPSSSSSTPLNTEEIGPSSRGPAVKPGGSSSMAATPPPSPTSSGATAASGVPAAALEAAPAAAAVDPP